MSRFADWIRAHERDCYFWAGLGLTWLGLAGARSPWWASCVVGAALFLVAVFGVAKTTAAPLPPPPRIAPEID